MDDRDKNKRIWWGAYQGRVDAQVHGIQHLQIPHLALIGVNDDALEHCVAMRETASQNE